jgi:hypothetical protein
MRLDRYNTTLPLSLTELLFVSLSSFSSLITQNLAVNCFRFCSSRMRNKSLLSLQASFNGSHEIQAILSKTSDHVSSGVSSAMSEDQRAALNMKKPNQIDRHNPFIDHRSLVVEDILEPACSIQSITDDASTEPICTDSKTDSFSNLVTGSTELIEVRTAESASSSNPYIQLSEKGNNDSENLASKEINEAVDEAAVATSSSCNRSEDKSKCDVDGITDVHGINHIDEENGIVTDNVVSKTLVQFDSAVAQTAPESSTSTACTGNGDTSSESNFFGPSIMSDPVTNSGHIAYSGNISLRSDSSTTSTWSFAFPV